ncbi:MAG: LysM peptidoglycan-binding domain-containing protein [Brevinematia bacterium]
MRNLSILILIFVSLGIFLGGCPSPKPEQELNKAKEMLEMAQKEEAPVYAKSEFDTALVNYQDATNLVNKGNNDEAKKKALISITNSELSISKTRKSKAEQSLSKFDSLIKDSESLKMNIIYPDEYNKFSQGYTLSKSLYESSNYYDSYTNSTSILPQLEGKISELRDRWNTAKTELSNAISKIERLRRVAKWLSEDIMEIDNLISQSKEALDNAKLDDSIQKSREALEKINSLSSKLKDFNQQQLQKTDEKIKELKINKIKIIFMHFAKKVNISEISYKLNETKMKLAILYDSPKNTSENTSEEITTNETRDVKSMSDDELNQYKTSLEQEISSLKEEIKTLYKEAEDDYNAGNYEDSLDKLDRVNILLDIYPLKQKELNKVLMEIDQRSKKVVQVPKQEQKQVKVETYKSYTVKKGDFLSKIASRLFNGEYWWWPKIFTLNKDKIKDPDLVEVGTELNLPNLKKNSNEPQ